MVKNYTKLPSKRDTSILIGNSLDHFDTTLYGFLAPILAPIFFPNSDQIVSLIMAYSIIATSILTRPLGVYIFGIIASKMGPLIGLSYSLIGIAITTVMIGFIPPYEVIGPYAPALLIIIRCIWGIFAAGETAIAKLFILEDKTDHDALRSSYLYQASSMIGIVVASLASTIVIYFNISYGWRLCFLLGGVTGFIGYYIRKYNSDTSFVKKNNFIKLYSIDGIITLLRYKEVLLKVAILNSFSYITYSIPFIVMNNLIPLITDIDLKTMMSFNTILLVLDLLLIPVVGAKLLKYDFKKIMLYSSSCLMITILPLWYYIQGASLFYICFVRIWIVFLGVIFLCPLNIWCQKLIPGGDKYLVIGIGNAIGASTIGKMTPAICLSLYYYSNSPVAVGIYIFAITLATVLVITDFFPNILKKFE